MKKAPTEHPNDTTLSDVIRLLHGEASAEDFVGMLAYVESLDIPIRKKSLLLENIRMAMAVHNRIEAHQKRERGLLAVIESAQDLSRHLDLMDLLNAIASKSRTLLGSDVAWISKIDPETEKILVMVTDGAVFQDTDKMTTPIGYGVGSAIIDTGLPFTTANYLSDDRFMHDPTLDSAFKSEGVDSLVGVPLISDGEVVGLLFVADRYHRSHTAIEVSILSTLATHAAVAITTANAFQTAKEALEKSDAARHELKQYAASVQEAADAHEQLTSLIAQGASLSTLCDAVATLLSGSIVVVDEAMQVICRATSEHYEGIAGSAYVPYGDNSMDIEKAIRESRLAGRSVIAYDDGLEMCSTVPVIAGEDVVGAVLLFRHEGLDEFSRRTYERASTAIGIMLLSHERIEIHNNRDRLALLRGLLLPHEYEWSSTVERACQFDIDLASPLSLVLIESDSLNSYYIARRLSALSKFPNAVLNEIEGVVAIVCKSSSAQNAIQDNINKALDEIVIDCRGVLSKPVLKAQGLPEIYKALRRALFIAKRLGMKGIQNQSELALYSILFESDDRGALEAFLDSSIGKLLAHDQKKGSGLALTLLTYFDLNRNASLVAKRMEIHVNTVRQRLNTIEGLVGHLGNATRALEIHMALRLWALNSREKQQ